MGLGSCLQGRVPTRPLTHVWTAQTGGLAPDQALTEVTDAIGQGLQKEEGTLPLMISVSPRHGCTGWVGRNGGTDTTKAPGPNGVDRIHSGQKDRSLADHILLR